MRYLPFLLVLTGCSMFPEVAQDIEAIATDDAVVVKLNKDALRKDREVSVVVNVTGTK